MKLEFDTSDTRQVRAAYELVRSLMDISAQPRGSVTLEATPASPPKAAATTAASAPTASAPAATSAETTSPTPAAATTADVPAADFASVAAAFQTYVKANGPAKAKALLAETGFAKVQDIPQGQLGAFLAKLTA